jgi:hypothetical protein
MVDSSRSVVEAVAGTYEEELLSMIDRLLTGELSFDAFAHSYYEYFFDSVPGAALDDRVLDFFSTIAEKLDFTGPAPDKLSRSYGWIDPSQFVSWLREYRHSYPS